MHTSFLAIVLAALCLVTAAHSQYVTATRVDDVIGVVGDSVVIESVGRLRSTDGTPDGHIDLGIPPGSLGITVSGDRLFVYDAAVVHVVEPGTTTSHPYPFAPTGVLNGDVPTIWSRAVRGGTSGTLYRDYLVGRLLPTGWDIRRTVAGGPLATVDDTTTERGLFVRTSSSSTGEDVAGLIDGSRINVVSAGASGCASPQTWPDGAVYCANDSSRRPPQGFWFFPDGGAPGSRFFPVRFGALSEFELAWTDRRQPWVRWTDPGNRESFNAFLLDTVNRQLPEPGTTTALFHFGSGQPFFAERADGPVRSIEFLDSGAFLWQPIPAFLGHDRLQPLWIEDEVAFVSTRYADGGSFRHRISRLDRVVLSGVATFEIETLVDDLIDEPGPMLRFGPAWLFAANDGVRGREPWITWGSPRSTRIFADVRPGPSGSSPIDWHATDTHAFFRADDRSRELYAIDAVELDWLRSPVDGYWYRPLERANWQQSFDAARLAGGRLAVFRSADEVDWVARHMPIPSDYTAAPLDGDRFWLALRRVDGSAEDWEWVDGSVNRPRLDFAFWCSGEPNDPVNERKGQIAYFLPNCRTGRLNDARANVAYYAITQRLTRPTAFEDIGTGCDSGTAGCSSRSFGPAQLSVVSGRPAPGETVVYRLEARQLPNASGLHAAGILILGTEEYPEPLNVSAILGWNASCALNVMPVDALLFCSSQCTLDAFGTGEISLPLVSDPSTIGFRILAQALVTYPVTGSILDLRGPCSESSNGVGFTISAR